MEVPKVIEYSKMHDTLKSIASEHMSLFENKKNPDLVSRYPEIFISKEGDTKYELQLTDPMSNPKDEMKIGDKQVKIVARFWKNVGNNGDSNRSSVCYSLGEDGKWYSLTSDTPRYDSEKNTTYWTQKAPTEVNSDTVNVEITSVIKRLKKETK